VSCGLSTSAELSSPSKTLKVYLTNVTVTVTIAPAV
jgi:hypothetical protein